LHIGNSLPATGVIAKPSAYRNLNTMVTKFFPSDSHALTYAFDLFPHNFHGKWLFVGSIGGEESSATTECIKLSGQTDFSSLSFNPCGYLSGRFDFDPGGFHSHGFTMSTHVLSSGETTGHQHPYALLR